MLFHIYSSPSLIDDIRLEITPYLAATQPRNTFGIPEPPRLIINDVVGLVGVCPLLKAVFYECFRLYSRPLSVRKVTKSFAVADITNHESAASVCQQFAIESGAYLVAPLGLQDHDSGSFEAPELFKPSRFLSVGQDGKRRCIKNVIRPWGEGESAGTGRYFAEKQVLILAAAVISLWDIESTSLKTLETPKHHIHSVVAAPRSDIRVLLRARELSSGG